MFSTKIIIFCSNNMRCYTDWGTSDKWLSVLATFREKKQKNYLVVKFRKRIKPTHQKDMIRLNGEISFCLFPLKYFIFKVGVHKFSRPWTTLAEKMTTTTVFFWVGEKPFPLETGNILCSLYTWLSDSNTFCILL